MNIELAQINLFLLHGRVCSKSAPTIASEGGRDLRGKKTKNSPTREIYLSDKSKKPVTFLIISQIIIDCAYIYIYLKYIRLADLW